MLVLVADEILSDRTCTPVAGHYSSCQCMTDGFMINLEPVIRGGPNPMQVFFNTLHTYPYSYPTVFYRNMCLLSTYLSNY